MEANQPVFFKEMPLLTQVQGTPHLVHFAAGYSKTVDPLTGMTVNLIWIHQWLLDLKIHFENMEFPDFLVAIKSYQNFLADIGTKAFADASEQILVPAVQLRFLDGSILRYKPNAETKKDIYSFEKSGATVLTEPSDFSKTVRVAKVFFEVQSPLELLQAQEFFIPTSFAAQTSTDDEFLAELKKKTALRVLRLEMWDPIRQVAQVVGV